MFENFEVKLIFVDQPHERHQFKLSIQGIDYQGLFHEKEIQWFNPHPEKKFDENHVESIESQVHELMEDHLKQ